MSLSTTQCTDTQISLRFYRPAEASPEVERLVAWLDGRGWVLARAVLEAWEIPPTEDHKRWLRDLVQSSGGRIVSGQKGYKLTRQTTPEELASVAWLKEQGVAMIKHYNAILRVWHGKGNG